MYVGKNSCWGFKLNSCMVDSSVLRHVVVDAEPGGEAAGLCQNCTTFMFLSVRGV